MSLLRAYTATRVIEAADNYGRSTVTLSDLDGPPSMDMDGLGDDEYFWKDVLADPDAAWNRSFYFHSAIVSEWVPRVPGLYWRPESRSMRKLRPELIERISDGWRTLRPHGKSQKVMGGVGTLCMAPSTDGALLATLTTTANASAGVPILIEIEAWEHYGLTEGAVVHGLTARWAPMASRWVERFPSIRGIPRGCLVFTYGGRLDVDHTSAPVQIHPFTIMRYFTESTELYDFVYASGDTGYSKYRQELEAFFDQYKRDNERHGEYLIAPDHVTPLWEATFDSPEQLSRARPDSDAQLALLEARVRERMLGESTIEELMRLLAGLSHADLKRLGTESQTPPSTWFLGGTAASEAAQLVDAALNRGTLGLLVDAYARDYPETISP